jgi:DNA polymerase III gamma/tau subunit
MTSLPVKYRPAAFKDVVGQDQAINSLKKVVKDGRAKSFIFTGPSGTGKTTLARILANSFSNGAATLANVEEIDAATNSGADDMRAVINRSFYRAVGGSPTKAIIIDEAHRLSAAAWTILLKPIEEPPNHVYWMLCTTEAGKIPKTIQTRCLRYDLKPVKEELILELLIRIVENEGFEIGDEIIEACAEAAAGSPRQAIIFLEGCLHCKTVAEAQAIMRSAGQNREVVDLCRWLIGGRGHTWAEAVKHVQSLDGVDAEGARITIVNYLAAVLMNTKGDVKARELLAILEPFLAAYNPSDRMAPLLHSLGLALNLDQ